MKRRLAVTVLCLVLILLNTNVNAFTNEGTGIQHQATEEKITEETHEEIHAEPHKAVPVPKIYYFYWGVLLLTLLIVAGYFYRIYKELPQRETLTFAALLIICGLVLYLVEQMPSFAGYFDTGKKIFVEGYHEPVVMSFLRFIYKIVLGILFVVYAFLGMEHHGSHKSVPT